MAGKNQPTIIEGYDVHKFLNVRESSETNEARFASAFDLGSHKQDCASKGGDNYRVLSDIFMGTPPLFTPRNLWTSIRRMWSTLTQDQVLDLLIAPCPMTAELGLAPYWLVPNTSRMVCQSEDLNQKLVGSDRNTTLFTVKYGPNIPEPAGSSVRWDEDEVLGLAERIASDSADRGSEALDLPYSANNLRFAESQERKHANFCLTLKP